MNKAPVFVVGAPRSGTTLVAAILGRHNDVFAAGESHYFEDIWSRRRVLGDLKSEDSITAAVGRLMTLFARFNFPETQGMVQACLTRQMLTEQVQMLGGGYGTLYYIFMSSLTKYAGKKIFCDDTPKHLYYIKTIFDFFPQAKVIGCVRDPRDFLCSYKNYWRKSVESTRVKALYHPVITSFLWYSSSSLLLKYIEQFSSDRITMVQYERLVSHPREEVSRICRFLELDYSDELVQVETNNSSFESTSAGIFTTSIERWRSCLTPEEVWYVQKLAGSHMFDLAYEVEAVHPSTSALLIALLGAPSALFRAVRINTEKRGPFLTYMARRVGSLLGL